MNCYKTEIKEKLDNNRRNRDRLFKRGFLITDFQGLKLDEYPFYGLWSKNQFGSVSIYVQKEESVYTFSSNGFNIALIGHAWNPYTETIDEKAIIADLLNLYINNNTESFLDKVDCLTGIFVIVIEHKGVLELVQDCSGPMSVYFGKVSGYVVLSSSPQLVGDVFELERDHRVERLVDTKGYKHGSGFLPGDVSPFKELKRLGCNTKLHYNGSSFSIIRIFPRESRLEITTESEKERVIGKIYWLMSKNVELALKNGIVCHYRFRRRECNIRSNQEKPRFSNGLRLLSRAPLFDFSLIEDDKTAADAVGTSSLVAQF